MMTDRQTGIPGTGRENAVDRTFAALISFYNNNNLLYISFIYPGNGRDERQREEASMPTISFDTIISILRTAAGEVWSRRNDEKYWSGWFSDGESGKLTVKKVSLEASGLTVEVQDEGGTSHTLKAVPTTSSRAAIYYNGAVDPDARLVFDVKGTIPNPTRFAFDFRPVNLGNGKTVRFNLRYDP
jgi:hypothetical protein